MKRIALILVLACAVCAGAFAQSDASYYVSARGNDDNDGLSESRPFKTLYQAFAGAFATGINKVTVIGTLNKDTVSDFTPGDVFVFGFNSIGGLIKDEIIITGKPGATGAERAVLSGRRSNAITVDVRDNARIRFEHIEISGGEGEYGCGIYIEDAYVTLGPGAVVRSNAKVGIGITGGTCVIDGGEVRDNVIGVVVAEKGVVTMQSGIIRDNRSPGSAGGVVVASGGRFTMSGGSITGNSAAGSGGGVYVSSGGRFDQTGGTISGNTAPRGPNIYRERGSLGSDLASGTSTPPATSPPRQPSSGSSEGSLSTGPSSGSSSSPGSSSSSAPSGFGWNIPLFFGLYLQGFHANTVSLGVPVQLGVEFDFWRVASIAILAEAGAGLGWPYIIEYHYGGMAELYFADKRFGLGAGLGSHGAALRWEAVRDDYNSGNSNMPETLQSFYTRFALFYRNKGHKLSLYAQYYGNNWGFGLTWGKNIFE